MKRLYLAISLLLVCLSTFGGENWPKVIPALQKWESAKGFLLLKEKGTIYVSEEDKDQLEWCASQLAEDIKEMFGWQYSVEVERPSKNAIILSLDDSAVKQGEESYEMKISDNVTIKASDKKGVFWGTRTLLQMICNQPSGLQKGKAIDYPEYPSRGFMIDVGRKFFSLNFLKEYIKIMAFYKMNELQVHLSDNGFVEFFNNDWNKTYSAYRLESERYPGLAAKDGHYTKEEFRNLQIWAAKHGIKIIPEIDVPAHSLAFVHYNPNLAASCKEYGMDHLDLYKDEVYTFVDNLFDEYLSGDTPVFIGNEVHIGTDEYNMKEGEQFRVFTNHCINMVKKYGKTPRLWGSLNQMKGNTKVDLNGTVVSAWNYDWMDMESAIKAGAKVVNMCDNFLYIVPAVNYYHDFLDYKWLYENWTPEMMKEGHKMEKNPNILGAMFAVWNDRIGNGISEQDVHIRAFPAMQLLSEKLWKGDNHNNNSYSSFEKLCKATPEAPGVNLAARVDAPMNLTECDKEIKLCGTNYITSNVKEIGYPYSVEFEVCADEVPVIDAILFKGPHSEFIANWHNTGKFAFSREGYEMVFHNFSLEPGRWTKVKVEGNKDVTSLYIDGELKERLEGKIGQVYNRKAERLDKIWYRETLIFPLEQIGDSQQGFKGIIKNVRCEHGNMIDGNLKHSTYVIEGGLKKISFVDRINFRQFDYIYLMAAPNWKSVDFGKSQDEINRILVENHKYAKDGNLEIVPYFIRKAQENNTRVMISFAGEGFIDIVKDQAKRERFTTFMTEFVDKYNYDGIEIDWESELDVNLHCRLMKEIRAKLDKMESEKGRKLYLTTALHSWRVYSKDLADELAKYVDWINIMTYDMGGGIWGNQAGHNTPLNGIERELKNWEVFSKSKLNIGLANYGFRYKGIKPGQKIDGKLDKYGCYFSYNSFLPLLKEGWESEYDNDAKVNYFYSPDRREFVTMENPETIKIKLKWIKQRKYLGVFWWEFSYDAYVPDDAGEYVKHYLIDIVRQ